LSRCYFNEAALINDITLATDILSTGSRIPYPEVGAYLLELWRSKERPDAPRELSTLKLAAEHFSLERDKLQKIHNERKPGEASCQSMANEAGKKSERLTIYSSDAYAPLFQTAAPFIQRYLHWSPIRAAWCSAVTRMAEENSGRSRVKPTEVVVAFAASAGLDGHASGDQDPPPSSDNRGCVIF